MEELLRDIYGDARLVADGAIPAAALTGSPDFIRAMRGVRPPGGRYLQLYAADLGRGPDGRWWVLGDRTQAPSGAGYELENRLVLSRAYPNLYNAMNVERLAPFFAALRRGLAAAAERKDPRICLLTPGPYSETYFEQAHLARYLGFLLVEGDDLVVRDGRAYVRTIAGLKRVDVILRRVDADFVDPLELNSASRLGVPGLLEAIRVGGVAVLNMPGSGVLESKALLGFLPKLCRRLLGEELKMPNVATWWCGQPSERARVQRDPDLAIGPAFNVQQPDGIFSRPRLVADLSAQERREIFSRLKRSTLRFCGPGSRTAFNDAGSTRRPIGARSLRAQSLCRGNTRRILCHARGLLSHFGLPGCARYFDGGGRAYCRCLGHHRKACRADYASCQQG